MATKKSILQVENTNADDFKNEILNGVKEVFQGLALHLQSDDENTLWTREETAKKLGVSLTTLWDYTRKDLIPAYRIGSKIRYRKSDVMNSLKKQNQFN